MPKMTVITSNESTNVDWNIREAVRELHMRRFNRLYCIADHLCTTCSSKRDTGSSDILHTWNSTAQLIRIMLKVLASFTFRCFQWLPCDGLRVTTDGCFTNNTEKKIKQNIWRHYRARGYMVCKGLNYFICFIWMNECICVMCIILSCARRVT